MGIHSDITIYRTQRLKDKMLGKLWIAIALTICIQNASSNSLNFDSLMSSGSDNNVGKYGYELGDVDYDDFLEELQSIYSALKVENETKRSFRPFRMKLNKN